MFHVVHLLAQIYLKMNDMTNAVKNFNTILHNMVDIDAKSGNRRWNCAIQSPSKRKSAARPLCSEMAYLFGRHRRKKRKSQMKLRLLPGDYNLVNQYIRHHNSSIQNTLGGYVSDVHKGLAQIAVDHHFAYGTLDLAVLDVVAVLGNT